MTVHREPARTVQSEPLEDTISAWTANRIAAYVAWLLSVFFTFLCVIQLAPAMSILLALLIAFVGQFLFTVAERPLWRWILKRDSGKWGIVAAIVTLIDGAINAGGIYTYIPRIANTGLGKMFIHAFSLSPNVNAFAQLSISLFIGTLTAGLYEYLEGLDYE